MANQQAIKKNKIMVSNLSFKKMYKFEKILKKWDEVFVQEEKEVSWLKYLKNIAHNYSYHPNNLLNTNKSTYYLSSMRGNEQK